MNQTELAQALGISKFQVTKWKARGMPIGDLGECRNWIKSNIKQRSRSIGLETPPKAKDLPPPVALPGDEHSWEARLARARETELGLYRSVEQARRDGHTATLKQLQAMHASAVKAVAEAERIAADVRIHSGELLHRETARAIIMEVMTPIRNNLDLLPMTERARCNPTQPEIAEAALRTWRDMLLARLSQAESRF